MSSCKNNVVTCTKSQDGDVRVGCFICVNQKVKESYISSTVFDGDDIIMLS